MVIALFTALIAPYFIDWTSFRQGFEKEASRIVGQPVHVAGKASLRILPLPTVTFTDVSVGEYEDGTPMMTVEAFSMDAELLPFLSGEVKIVDMRLDRPMALVRVSSTGAIDWTSRKQLIVDPQKVELENLTVTNGSFVIDGLAGGNRISGQGINAKVGAQALTGPWHIDADGEMDGSQTQMSISTGRLQEDGSIRFAIDVRRNNQPYRLQVDGPLKLDSGVLSWSGKFSFTPAIGADGKREADALPVFANGVFEATPERINVEQYQLDIGNLDDPYTITGKGLAEIGSVVAFRVEADGRQIDLDRIGNSRSAPEQKLTQRLAAVRAIVDRIPVPPAIGEISLEIPAVVAGDTVIREISAIVKPDGTGWRISNLRASLPGNTTIEADGLLGVADDFGYSGRMLLATRQPTGFANWLAGGSDQSLRRLKSAGFSANVTLTQNQTSFDALELALDNVIIKGSLQRLQPENGRPAIIANLSGDTIDIEDLKAIQSLIGGDATGFSGHDLDVALSAGEVRHDGMRANDVDAHMRITDGSLSLDRLNIGSLYGAQVESSGNITDLLGSASGSFGLRVTAVDGSGLVSLARERLGANRFLDALLDDQALSDDLDAQVKIEARPEGEGARASISLMGKLGGTQFSVSDRIDGRLIEWQAARHDLTVKLSNEMPSVLARQLSLPALPLDTAGPVSVDLELAGTALEKLDFSIALRGSQTELVATGVGKFAPLTASSWPDFSKPQVDAALTAGSGDVDPFIQLFGFAPPGMGSGTPLSLKAGIKSSDNAWVFENLSGQLAGNAFSGALSLDIQPAARPKISGNLNTSVFSLPVLVELATGSGTIAGDELTGEVYAEFGQPVFDGLDFDIAVEAQKFLTGVSEEGVGFSGQAKLSGETLSLTDFSFQWFGGTHKGTWTLQNVSGSAVGSLSGSLAGADASLAMVATGHPPFLSGRANVTYSLEMLGRSLPALIAGLSGSGTAQLAEGKIEGINLEGLPQILAGADVDKFEINPQTVAPLAQSAILSGSLSTSEVGAAFSVKDGVVEIRNLSLQPGLGSNGRLAAEGKASLVSGESTLSLALTLDAGDEALAGAEPSATLLFEGIPGAMKRSFDTTALEGFLALRSFEREQRRVEILQANVLEKQRLRREVVVSNARIAFRERQRQEELARLEALQKQIEAERKAAEEAQERRKAEVEAARKAAEEVQARKEAEEQQARKAAEEEKARKAVEEEKARKAAQTLQQPALPDAIEQPQPPVAPKNAADQPVDLLENINKLFVQ